MEVRGGEIYQMDLRFSWKSLFNYLVMCYNLAWEIIAILADFL